MTKIIWKTFVAVCVVVCAGIAACQCHPGEGRAWQRYFDAHLGAPPRPLLLDALTYFRSPGFVLSLGCGAGNDEVYLLKHGWHVTCVEKQQLAIAMMKQRPEVMRHANNIRFIQTSFEALSRQDLEHYDFVYAGYSIPFCSAEHMDSFIALLLSSLNVNGLFAADFFGPAHQDIGIPIVRFSDAEIRKLLTNVHILRLDKVVDTGKGIDEIHVIAQVG